mmetsp:Transcript_18956/g.42207  ORF Transcript_18956/g.42207 Transcript_18956/m.42207 type:complete len:204 (+) Transcript_18956:215-826(+)
MRIEQFPKVQPGHGQGSKNPELLTGLIQRAQRVNDYGMPPCKPVLDAAPPYPPPVRPSILAGQTATEALQLWQGRARRRPIQCVSWEGQPRKIDNGRHAHPARGERRNNHWKSSSRHRKRSSPASLDCRPRRSTVELRGSCRLKQGKDAARSPTSRRFDRGRAAVLPGPYTCRHTSAAMSVSTLSPCIAPIEVTEYTKNNACA